jgi:hypothetical protein
MVLSMHWYLMEGIWKKKRKKRSMISMVMIFEMVGRLVMEHLKKKKKAMMKMKMTMPLVMIFEMDLVLV